MMRFDMARPKPVPPFFRDELDRLGWSEGRNLHIEYRFGAGRSEQYLPLAAQGDTDS
jgi:hypothetical protein